MILSRTSEIVRIRTIILQEECDSYEVFPSLSSTTPFEPFRDAGSYPRRTSGASILRRIDGLILLPCFQVE